MNAKSKIVVIGSSNIDLIMIMEHLPKKGETVTDADFQQVNSRKGVNQAIPAACAGRNDAYTNKMIGSFAKKRFEYGCASEGIEDW